MRLFLIVFYLHQIIATVFPDRFQQWSLCMNRIAAQQFQARIYFKKFTEMLFQTPRSIRLVAANRPTYKVNLKILYKNVGHENRIAVIIFHLFGHLAVHGGGENGIDKQSKGVLQVVQREPLQDTGECYPTQCSDLSQS